MRFSAPFVRRQTHDRALQRLEELRRNDEALYQLARDLRRLSVNLEERALPPLRQIEVDPAVYDALTSKAGISTTKGYTRLTLLGVELVPHTERPGVVVLVPQEKPAVVS